MPQAIPVPLRETVIYKHLQGQSLSSIAKELQLSLWTVRHLWRQHRDNPQAGFKPNYPLCGNRGTRASRRIYRGALWLRRQHPGWGAGIIRVLLQQRWPDETLVSERTLQRWFGKVGLTPSRQRLPTRNRCRGTTPHEVWQMDAKEQVRLADGSYACWLTIIEENTGALLAARVFPPALLVTCGAHRRARGVAPRLWSVGIAKAPAC